MSDELNPLEISTRKAFRAFYGEDDPIQFADLTKEQRKQFEAVALSFQDKKEAEEIEGFVAKLSTLRDRIVECLVPFVSGEAGRMFINAVTLGEPARAFDILSKPLLEEISNVQEHYDRRSPHR